MLPALDGHILGNRQIVVSVESSLARGDVIEIQGPAASGKSQLLYHLAASCILPKEVLIISTDVPDQRMVHLGGWCGSAIVFDCDGRWDTRRLHDMLLARLKVSFSKTQLPPLPHKSNSTISSIALDALSRLHVFRPTSSFQLAATLLNLPKYHAEQMPDEEIRLLFVDSISSFYWADRWQAEYSGSKKTHRSNPLGHVLQYLQAFRRSHGPVIVLTNWGLNPLSSTTSPVSPTPFFKQHLSSPFPAPFDEPPRPHLGHPTHLPLNCHITLPFAFISQLQLNHSRSDSSVSHEGGQLEEALRDERRKEVVSRGEIGGYVRIRHSGQDGSAVGRFNFQVLVHDVVASLNET
jgi:DNA-repair protein XRCC2